MNTLYNFATGPLAWLAFVVCIGGIIWRLWSYALLVCLPFTRLSHAFLIPFTRAYMGSESIGVRRTCDW